MYAPSYLGNVHRYDDGCPVTTNYSGWGRARIIIIFELLEGVTFQIATSSVVTDLPMESDYLQNH
jgi:hypothetical protein